MKFMVRTTWVKHGTRNAAGIGNDETATIEADSARIACREMAENHLCHHEADWDTGNYDIVADHLNGYEVYSIEFCEA